MSTVVISTRVALTDLAFVYRYLESEGIIPKTKSELVRYGMSMCAGGLSRALSLPLLTEEEAYTLLQNTQLFNPEEIEIPAFEAGISSYLVREADIDMDELEQAMQNFKGQIESPVEEAKIDFLKVK